MWLSSNNYYTFSNTYRCFKVLSIMALFWVGTHLIIHDLALFTILFTFFGVYSIHWYARQQQNNNLLVCIIFRWTRYVHVFVWFIFTSETPVTLMSGILTYGSSGTSYAPVWLITLEERLLLLISRLQYYDINRTCWNIRI